MSSHYLIRGTDPDGTDRIEITGEMIVGRSDDCDIQVQDGHPSRRHARLTLEAGTAWVEDLGSANGTFVNDRPIAGRTELRPGDRIAFDLATFVVAAPGVPDHDATVVRSAPADADATVVRPPPAEAAQGDPPPAPPRQEQPPAPPPPAAEAPAAPRETTSNVPRSWADPEYQTAGTRVLSKEELRAMAAGVGPATGSAAGPGDQLQGPHLRVISGNSAGTVLMLDPAGKEWSIGAEAGRDLRLDDEGVSAFHAKITHDDARWRIIDQMSANGTWVNDDKVTVSYLANGDRIRFAQVECEIQVSPAGRSARPRPAAGAGRSSGRTWMIAVAVAVVTVAALALLTWLG